MFHLHFQKPKNPWGACPTRIGASWASFIAAFGQRCCGTITGAASCWMDWPMSPSGTRFEWFCRMVVIWCPKIPLLPWPAMACHGLPWPAMAYDVGFLPPFFFWTNMDRPKRNVVFEENWQESIVLSQKSWISACCFLWKPGNLFEATSWYIDQSIQITRCITESWSSPVDQVPKEVAPLLDGKAEGILPSDYQLRRRHCRTERVWVDTKKRTKRTQTFRRWLLSKMNDSCRIL